MRFEVTPAVLYGIENKSDVYWSRFCPKKFEMNKSIKYNTIQYNTFAASLV